MKSRFSFLSVLKHSNTRNFLLFTFFLSFLFLTGSNLYSQTCQAHHNHEYCSGLEAAPFNGYFYTPPADWILEKMNSRSQSLIGDPPCSTIAVTYTGFTPEAQAAFQYAVEIWETILSSPVDITIDAVWEPLSPGILGSTGTSFERNFPDAPTSDYYAASISNQIAGFDISPGSFDMNMSFSSVFDWYLGLDGNPAADEYDFVTVVLHEIGHGLGFVSSKGYNSFTGVGDFGFGSTSIPINYDRFLTLGSFGTDLLDLSGTALGDAFTGNNVFNNSPLAVAANGGVSPKIYAPATYAGGSSISHWDETTYAAGNPNSLMTPQLGAGEAIHDPGEISIGLLEDLGWTICYATVLANDAPCDALPIDCGETVSGNTDLASFSGVDFTCAGDYPDVFYSFEGIAGVEYIVTVNGDAYDGILAAYTGVCDGVLTSLDCSDSGTSPGIEETITFTLGSSQTVLIQTAGWGSTGAFDLTLNGAECGTTEVACTNSIAYPGVFLDGTDAVLNIFCAYEEEYSLIANAVAGDEYTFTTTTTFGQYLTVRSGTFDGPVVGSGFSPLTVIPDVDGSLFLHYNADEFCGTSSGNCVDVSIQCISCGFDCPLLGGNIGDPCDDGNPATENDVITADCACLGTIPAPENDTCADAIPLVCDAYVVGTNVGASLNTGCDGDDRQTVWYSFTTETAANVFMTTCNPETNYDTDINMYTGACDGGLVCFPGWGGAGYIDGNFTCAFQSWASEGSFIAEPGITYYIAVTGFYAEGSSFGWEGSFGLSLTCELIFDCPLLSANIGDACDDGNAETENDVVTADCNCVGTSIYDCPDLSANIGDACDDGNPETNNDIVNGLCECAGNLPCLTSSLFASTTLNGTDEVFTISTCNLLIEYNEVFNVFEGDDYTFTAIDNENASPAYITVRSGSFDGPVLASGFSPVTVTSDIDGALYAHYTVNEFCEEAVVNCITTTVQCISCFYDCPSIPAFIGDPCDDGDPETENDVVTADCGCMGTSIFDCPLLAANIGDACDDGNPETENDVVTADCACEGTIPAPANDLCENAQALNVNLPGDCAGNEVEGTTLGASSAGLTLSCETGNPEVYYSFNSGDNSSIQFNTLLLSATDLVLTVFEGACDGTEIYCSTAVSPLLAVAPFTDYTVGISTNTIFGSTGTFSICLEGVFDCPLLSANIGDACDDGNPLTENDVVTADCACEGTIVYDCPALAANIGDACDDGNAETENDVVTADCNCEGTNIYDCPALSANIGDACDDGNPATENDVVTADCACQGTVPAPENDTCADAIPLVCDAYVVGTNVGASLNTGCDGDDRQTVWYSFTTETAANVFMTTCNPETNYDTDINMYTGACDGGLVCFPGWGGGGYIDGPSSCDFQSWASEGTFIAEPGLTYYIAVTGFYAEGSSSGWEGSFGLSLSCETIYDCPDLSANIGDGCDDGNPETENDVVTADCNCEGTIVYDCPILSANIGDACDDGNPETENDVVTADCACEGTIPAPANDLCENAEVISVYEPGECPENQTIGTTLGANDDAGAFSCDSPGPWPDVFYTFNSGSFNTVQIDISVITQTDMVYGVSAVCGGDEVLCGIGSASDNISVTPNTDYFVRIAPNLAFGSPGTFSICISGVYDCPDLSANVGDACDDGNPNTDNDTVNSDCNCEGVSNETATLTGSADWNNSCGDRGLTIALYEPGTTTLVASYATNIDANGDFSLTDIPVGTFDIFAKIDGRLANGYYNQTISFGANSLALGSFIPGDLNNNNGINITDFSLLNISFGSSEGDANYNFLADMNCDGNVNIIDVSILNIGFGQVGDSPGAP